MEEPHTRSRQRSHCWAIPPALTVVVALVGTLPWPAAAQQPRRPAPAGTSASPAGAIPDADPATRDTPSSTETGQSPLDESFERRPPGDWVGEARRKAWRDTVFELQFRSFALDRDRYDGSESEAWALGASAGLKTGYFRERFALGATGYTSQRLHGPADKDGARLLKPGQHGFTVLGELYGEILLDAHTRLSIGRRGYDTPYLNRNDSRMVPNTFEAVVVQGLHGGGGGPELRFGVGYVDRIKPLDSDRFVSMATAAGAPAGVERGVIAGGANYRNGEFSIGAAGYHSDDILDIVHAEARHALPLRGGGRLRFALQYSAQASNGDDLLGDPRPSSRQWGGKVELATDRALFSTAYTRVGGDTGMRSPWGAYPGYTGVQVEDFNRAGESAWMLRAAWNLQSVPGLGVYGLWVKGSQPDAPGQYARDEVDVSLQWAPASGALEGLVLRLRYARVFQDDPGNSRLDDLRMIIHYNPPLR